MRLATDNGTLWLVADSLIHLGELARVADNLPAARSYYEDALKLGTDLGDMIAVYALINLANVDALQDKLANARRHYLETLAESVRVGDLKLISGCLLGLAYACRQRTPDRAARLLGAAEELNESIGVAIDQADRPLRDRAMKDARAALSSDEFAIAWQQGRSMTLESAIQFALEDGGV